MLRTIPRTVVTSYVSVARLPFDLTARVLGGSEVTGPKLAVDRADAAVRAFAGGVLRDPELKADAQRRRVAADERQRALELRLAAKRTKGEAQEQFEERQTAAQRKRQKAAEEAEQKQAQAARDAERERARVAEVERKRREAVEAAAAKKEKAIEDEARRARLEQLDREAEALADQEKALHADKTADRLKVAAGEAKAARKSS